jgi:hypothetical protein
MIRQILEITTGKEEPQKRQTTFIYLQWRSQPKIIGHASSGEGARLSRGVWGHAPAENFQN